ncbi:MAG TPA: phosphoglycerate dehydrogenase [Pirellulales bacterium]|jgi:D-3-phosphoglycerate dehydrogenase|nr:phosphoglycerate dehydrogenase [Pirellulales bacterium]
MPRVIVLDTLAQEGLDIFKAAPGIEYEVRTGLSGADLRTALAGADGAILRSGVKITAESLAGNRRLKAIVRAGVGTDNIDKDAATRLGIVVMNTPTGNTLSTAEHTVAMMLALSRNIAPAYQSLIEGRWDRNKYMGTQLADKTIGIVGLGRIGQAVASRAKALEMRVLGYDPFLSKERAQELGIELVPAVAEMLPHVDYLTVHTPLTPETKNLISTPQLEVMRRGVRLINCARGGIYDEAALVEGLKSGKLGGVALDVFATEPCKSSPLFGMPGVLCTPHLGASTEEAQTQVAVEGAHLLVDFLSTGAIRHAVNMSSVDPKKLAAMRDYLDLGYRLGRLLAQLDRTPTKACRLQYRGEIASKDTKLITACVAVGLLEHALEAEINIVNAEVLLRERGIELVEQSRSDMGAFSSVIQAELVTESQTYKASGTVFGQNMPRLVQLGEYRLDAFLDGVLMVFTHRDVPGIIGKVGTIFGTHRVNIAQMAVGRASDTPGGEAIGVLNLDTRPPQEAIDAVLGHPDLLSATVIELPRAGQLPSWLAVGGG